jgi:hypothetical protein
VIVETQVREKKFRKYNNGKMEIPTFSSILDGDNRSMIFLEFLSI